MDGSGALNAAAGLFPSLLGERFASLPPLVRELHLRGGFHRYHGEVEVQRGAGWLSRLCAWATRLPPAGHGPIAVELRAEPGSERWTRRVGGHAMPSRLWANEGLLCERLGLVTFAFHLTVEDATIVWRVARVHALGISLPPRWFSGVEARESEADGRYRFDVAAALPLAGLLVRYRGWLQIDRAQVFDLPN